MRKKATLTLSGLLLAILGILFGPKILEGSDSTTADTARSFGIEAATLPDSGGPAASKPTTPRAPSSSSRATSPDVDTRVGFTSKRSLEEHFAKHVSEFGSITQAQYLRLAQELRDAKVGGTVRETERADGVITRFDTRSGAFLAFHDDKTIRTFFKPNDGLRYFERQLDKDH